MWRKVDKAIGGMACVEALKVQLNLNQSAVMLNSRNTGPRNVPTCERVIRFGKSRFPSRNRHRTVCINTVGRKIHTTNPQR